MNKDTLLIRAKLESVTPDRTQFKPYAPTLTFDNVYVDIPVPGDHSKVEKGDKIVLTVDGMAVALDVVATAIEQMNERWMKSKQTPYAKHNPLKIEP